MSRLSVRCLFLPASRKMRVSAQHKSQVVLNSQMALQFSKILWRQIPQSSMICVDRMGEMQFFFPFVGLPWKISDAGFSRSVEFMEFDKKKKRAPLDAGIPIGRLLNGSITLNHYVYLWKMLKLVHQDWICSILPVINPDIWRPCSCRPRHLAERPFAERRRQGHKIFTSLSPHAAHSPAQTLIKRPPLA